MGTMRIKEDLVAMRLWKKAVDAGEIEALPLYFDASVLDAYRAKVGTQILRTDTAGRIKTQTWSLDFGISDDDRLIHAPIGQLRQRLPESERAHWLNHAVTLPTSKRFLQMQAVPGSCIQDGDVRPW